MPAWMAVFASSNVAIEWPALTTTPLAVRAAINSIAPGTSGASVTRRTPFRGDHCGTAVGVQGVLGAGWRHGAWCGVAGSGEAVTGAKVSAEAGGASRVVADRGAPAARLGGEIGGLGPENAVQYFVSYYDYDQ